MTVNYSGVIKKLKQLKTERGLTNEALAERSGVSLGTVNKLFAGSIGSIKLGTLASLAEALEAPLGNLLSIEERAPVTPPKPNRADNFGFVMTAFMLHAGGELEPVAQLFTTANG